MPHLIEHIFQSFLCQSRALDILNSPQLPREPLSLINSNRPLLLPSQLLRHLRVIPQINLCANNKAWDTGTMMMHFWEPFLFDVLE